MCDRQLLNLALILLLIAAGGCARDTGRVTLQISAPESTPSDAELAIGGAFNDWDPTQGAYGIVRGADGAWQGDLPEFPAGRLLQFKITRGSWATVEVAPDGSDIDDRRYKVMAGRQTLALRVAAWADQQDAPPRRSTAVVPIIRELVELPTFGGDRAIFIYLPSDYQRSERRYPVIYMTDGRNLFDQAVGARFEWGMDELMERFATEGSPLTSIVVGVDHAGEYRHAEYSPWDYSWSASGTGTGKGDQWADWLVNNLKPSIDARYRTRPGRLDTTIMGSSMGGLIACYTALRYQEVFARAGCYSPAFLKQLVGNHWLDYIRSVGRRQAMRIHMDVGDAELDLYGPSIFDDMKEVEATMLQAGFGREEIRYQVIPGGVHNERDWRARTEDILRWLNG